MLGNFDHRQPALKLRLAGTAKDALAAGMRMREPAMAQWNAHGAFFLADVITEKSAGPTEIGQAPREASNEVGFDPDKAITVEKVGSAGRIRRPDSLSGRANVRRSCALNSKFASSGLTCRGCFREIASSPHFPPPEAAVFCAVCIFPSRKGLPAVTAAPSRSVRPFRI